MRTNVGNDLVCAGVAGDTIGYSGVATAATATTLTATGTPWVVNAYIGHIVVATTTVLCYGICTGNTAGVATVDRWSVAATPDGAVATTPAATTPFIILPGNAPAFFMGLTANASAAAATDTALTAEIVTAGLLRKVAARAHTLGTSLVTLTGSWTATAPDVPVTVAKIAEFTSILGGIMPFETLLNATATLSAVGDPLTVTHSITV